MPGLTGGSEDLEEEGIELSLESRSRAVLKGLEIASCVRRCRTADVMWVERPAGCGGVQKGGNHNGYNVTGGGGRVGSESRKNREQRTGVRVQASRDGMRWEGVWCIPNTRLTAITEQDEAAFTDIRRLKMRGNGSKMGGG